jgi:hypothetical protein
MSPLDDGELQRRLNASAQVREYATPVDRESAREMLAARAADAARAAADQGVSGAPPTASTAGRSRATREPKSALEQALSSPLARTGAGVVTRGLMGALLVGTRRRRR